MGVIEEMAFLVNDKAKEIATDEIFKFKEEHPGCIMNEEIKSIVIQRAISQLSFSINNLHINKDGDIGEQFKAWFDADKDAEVRKICIKCIAEEVQKASESDEGRLTYLEKYMKKHGINI